MGPTPSELALFACEVQRGARGRVERGVLNEALVAEMLTRTKTTGLGPGISEDGERLRHGGSKTGSSFHLRRLINGDPRRRLFVMTNLGCRVRAGATRSQSPWRERVQVVPGPRNRGESAGRIRRLDVRERYAGTYVFAEMGIEPN